MQSSDSNPEADQKDVVETSRALSRARLAMAGLLLSLAAGTQMRAQEGPQRTRALIRVVGAKGDDAALPQKSDLHLRVNGNGTDLLALTPVLAPNSRGLEVALLIDDGLRGGFGVNLSDLKTFVETLPAGVAVGVGYMQNGRVIFPAHFTTEHEDAAKALRLPMGIGGVNASPYFCLSDLVKHWPTNTAAARVVLMITNGIDPYNGSTSPLNQNSPYVSTAVTDAQKAGVPVYSIYWGSNSFGIGSNRGSFSGQSYLQQVAEGTGGQMFNLGSINPPSIQPYLSQFVTALRETYSASFLAPAKRGPVSLKVKSSLRGTKVAAPSMVMPGAGVPSGS